MWWLLGVVLYYGGILFVLMQLVRLVFADADLALLYQERYGRKPERLRGQTVWITGASSGIGEYLAYRLAMAGCRLVLSARREAELRRVKERCLVSGPIKDEDVLVLPFDLTDFSCHASVTQKVLENFGHVDVLVNNGARSQRALVRDTALEVDRQMFELVVLAQLSLTKAVLPHFIERKGGHVVVTSSIAGKIGAANSATYSACKFALQGYFEALRVEHASDNIDVTLLCPGPVFSAVLEEAFSGQPGQKHGVQMNSSERRMSTERCADLMAIAIANKMGEVWISLQPILLFTYISQYAPDIARMIQKRMGMKLAMKTREGR